MTNAEIITIQLNTFKSSVEDAIVHRLEKLTVIHGIGTGRLRQEIFEILNEFK
jgi:dsDNA-specific endonuclease/ATPase MutS2